MLGNGEIEPSVRQKLDRFDSVRLPFSVKYPRIDQEDAVVVIERC